MINIKVDNEIVLKSIDVNNSEEIFNLINTNRNFLREWLLWVDDTRTVNDTINYISTVDQDLFSGRLVFEIWYCGNIAGLIDLHNGSKVNKSAEIGYWLSKQYNGKGIMTRACEACINYGFKTVDLNRIVIKCASGNDKSQAIPRRLNFMHEGIEREGMLIYNRFWDVFVFSILKKEWYSEII